MLPLALVSQWNSTFFFTFSLIIEGTSEKVLQFIMPFKSIKDKNLIELEMYVE